MLGLKIKSSTVGVPVSIITQSKGVNTRRITRLTYELAIV